MTQFLHAQIANLLPYSVQSARDHTLQSLFLVAACLILQLTLPGLRDEVKAV
jgi:hypothetical protein